MQGLIPGTTVWSALRGDVPVAVMGAVAFAMTLVSIASGVKTRIATMGHPPLH